MSTRSSVPLAYRKAFGWPKIGSALLCACIFIGTSLATQPASAQSAKEIHLDAAADLQPVLPVLAAAYEQATGVKLLISYGSSATLATQIIAGAPVDLFLSADYINPEKLVAANLTDGKAPTPYAQGTLVLWTRNDSGIHPLTIDSLTDPRVKTIAIANELHAPYGFAAAETLRRLKIYDKVSPRFVVAENIAQTAQFAESGNAQLGLISLTTASTAHFKEIGNYVLMPKVYPPIQQCAVVIAKSERRTEAHAFLDWMLSSKVQDQLPKFGLTPVR